jgi:outer membrane protein OmpA-like peptidoglycan-associated protein/flagellar hook assembly protein FlgD
VVKEFGWKGTVPSEIVWDGRGEKGIPLDEGIYNYSITGSDPAGNVSEKRITGIVLTTEYEKVSLVANQVGISPNGDGVLDTVEFVPSLSSEKNLKSWYLDFYDNQGQRVKSMEGKPPVPRLLTWDGTDNNGNIVLDGLYYFKMGLMYHSGNHPSTETGKIIIDNSPPDHSFVVSPKLFSPDGDGEADTLYITTEIIDRNGVTEWSISIYRKWNEKIDRTTAFKRYSGKGNFKGVIRWDGYSDPMPMPPGLTAPDAYTQKSVGEKWSVLVDSASSYVAELTATDAYNNRFSEQREFETDILVIPTPYGLKIMINSIQFEFDKAELLPQSFSILNRLIQIIEKFPNYKILIVGHTDWVGSDEYNMKLSERRAYAVYKYLVEHDVDKERLSTEGRGETQPIDDNNTESGRARNRRVEFYLTKR